MKGITPCALIVSGVLLPALAQAAPSADTAIANAGFIDAAGPIAAAQFEHFKTIISLLVSGVVLINLSLGVGEFAKTGWVAYPPLSGLQYSQIGRAVV